MTHSILPAPLVGFLIVMKRQFDRPIIVLIIAELIQRTTPTLPDNLALWSDLAAKIIFGLGLLWLGVKALDWWGEEAPVRHPHRFGKLVRLTYREAQVRLRLIELFDGDARLARRQVRILMARFPERPEQWCWEKAIRDRQQLS